MPLILAIEPDKRQSAQLAGLVKGLQAELVQRAGAADGLAALQGRVPDLVLTTSLISPRDDSALAAHLRELGAAAAHVQTVTIPLLGTAAPTRARGGMLAALRREKPQAPMTDGCAPEVFAEQIRQYLATAEEQKATAATRLAGAPEAVAEEAVESRAVAPAAEFDTAPAAEAGKLVASEEIPAPVVEFVAPEPELVAEAPVLASEPWPAAAEEIEAAEPTVAAPVEAAEELLADEPAGLPLSQLLQLVSETAIVESPMAPPVEELAAAPLAEDVAAEFVEPIAETAPVVEPEPVLESEPLVELAPAEREAMSSFGDGMYVDPVATQALDELSRQAPQASLADGIPAEAPVPVVEMHSFQSLDSIASELAAEPAPRHESLDDLAGLFAASPTPKPARYEAAPPAPAEPELAAPPHGEKSLFASLFAEPVPVRPAPPVDVPGIDPSLFASTPAAPVASFEPEPAPPMAAAPESGFEPAPESGFEPAPEPGFEPAPEPVFEAAPEPVLATLAEPEPEPVLAELVAPEPEPAAVAALEPEPATDDSLVAFEPVVVAPAHEEPVAVAAAPALEEEEIALDVDSFAAALAEPEPAPAEPSRFSFTFVDGFGDAWSDFEVPAIGAVAADLGVGEHAPLDPYAAAPSRAAAQVLRESLREPQAAPALDEEALSLIGDAARKVGLDALVIEEFERGFPGRRVKKAKKKPHAGATQVTPAPERPAKPAKRPVQDEWGMFDPEQCGFAALEDEEGAENRPTTGTRVRIISY